MIINRPVFAGRSTFFMLSCLMLFLSSIQAGMAKEVVGWVENVIVYPGGVTVKAKVDTGAKTSSLDCECITPFQKDGEEWLSFTVKNSKGEMIRLEKPVTRVARIKRHFNETQVRYVVKLGLCLGSVYREEEVTLVDRSGFNYSLLVGRNFLGEDFVVDPSQTFNNAPSCKGAPE